MCGMLFAEFAIFLHFQSFSIVLFVFKSIVVSLLAFRTSQSNLCSCAFCCHNAPSEHQKITPLCRDADLFYQIKLSVSSFLHVFLKFLNKKHRKMHSFLHFEKNYPRTTISCGFRGLNYTANLPIGE